MNIAVLFGVLLIIVLFYVYSGIIGFNVAFIDISIFYISVIASFFVGYRLTLSCKAEKINVVLQILIIVMILLFVIFTLCPPDIPLFVAP